MERSVRHSLSLLAFAALTATFVSAETVANRSGPPTAKLGHPTGRVICQNGVYLVETPDNIDEEFRELFGVLALSGGNAEGMRALLKERLAAWQRVYIERTKAGYRTPPFPEEYTKKFREIGELYRTRIRTELGELTYQTWMAWESSLSDIALADALARRLANTCPLSNEQWHRVVEVVSRRNPVTGWHTNLMGVTQVSEHALAEMATFLRYEQLLVAREIAMAQSAVHGPPR